MNTMKQLDPVAMARSVITGPNCSTVEEQAQVAAAGIGRIQIEPSVPDKATGLNMPARDATFNNGSGYSGSINPGGPGDTTEFPANVAGLNATHSRVDPNAKDFPRLTANQPDGFTDRGSGVDNIILRGRG
jgi:hypothetical protein